MPDITLTVSDAAVVKLTEATAQYNAENNTALTVRQWVIRTIKTAALKLDLDTVEENARLAADAAYRASIEAAREQIIDDLDLGA